VTPEDHSEDVDEPLTPVDEESVRRLLLAASGPVPTPDDVAARLDDVLAGLQAERDGSAAAPVTDLAAHRRRSWPKVLVAAAAVVVVGVGIGNISDNSGGGGGDAATSARVDAAEGGRAAAPEAGEAEIAPPAEDSDATSERDTLLGTVPTSALPRIRTDSATLDAQRILDLALGRVATDEQVAPQDQSRVRACDIPAVSRGETLVAVRLEGRRASLLFGKEDAEGSREAQVYSCNDSESPVLVTDVKGP
jgi:hypothetical protein